jgi:hypothetical protein
MDPSMILNQYIFEEILDYVPAKELKELTTINKSWYEAITSSSVLMKKYFFGIRGDWIDDGDFKDVIRSSKRNFQKIIISDVTEIYSDVYEDILQCSSNNWKTVEIYGLKLKTCDELRNLFDCFETTVKNLVLSCVSVAEHSEPLEFEMKNLKNLRISHCDAEIASSVLKAAPNLVSLELQHTPEYDIEIIEYLKNMKTLKTLEMRGEWFNKFFTSLNVSEIQFQLEEFTITCIDYVMPQNILTNFLQFIDNQHSLKNIHLSEWFGLKVLFSIYQMTSIKELSIFISPFFRWNIAKLPVNNSIEILDVRTLDVTDELFNLLILLTASPSLKTLRLRSINELLAEFIMLNLKKVTEISLVHSNNCEKVKSMLPHVEFV